MNKNRLKITLTSLVSCFLLGLSSCGGDASAHIHTFSSEWTSDDTYHWHEATCEHKDLKKDYGPHCWGEWIIDIEATLEHDGTRHHVCETCSHSISETFPYAPSVEASRIYLASDLKNCTLFVGAIEFLRPNIFPVDATKHIKYISSDDEVLSISEEGIITANKSGSVLLTIYNDNNNNGLLDTNEPQTHTAYSVFDRDSDKYLSLDSDEITIKVGETVSINPVGHGFTATYFGYDVLDSSIATAYDKKVRGLAPGTTVLKITSTPSGSIASYEVDCKINVVYDSDESGVHAYDVEFTDEVKNLNVGDTYTPSYSIIPNDAVEKDVTIETDSDIISLNNGVVTANKVGTAILTIKTSNNKINRMRIVVSSDSTYESKYNNYYGNLSWTDSEDLKAKLHTIISTNKKSLVYTSNWDNNKNADSLIGDDSKVRALYSDSPIEKSATTSGWQREHCLAASILTGVTTSDATKYPNRATDFHNLYAAYSSGNTSRGNKNFGYANTDSLRYGSKEGTNTCYDDYNFEPANIDKGKVARAIMYMGVMYNEDETIKVSGKLSFTARPVELIEDNVDYKTVSFADFTNTSKAQCVLLKNYYLDIIKPLNPLVTDEEKLNYLAYTYMKKENNPASIGNLSTLLMWNAYQVDAQEMQHNNSVHTFNSTSGKGIQGNRNPFVDYPELAEYVYGSLKNQPGSISKLKPAVLDLA